MPDQIDSQVECPECFTKLKVSRPIIKDGERHSRWRQSPPEKSHIRKDEELSLSDPVERPKIDYNVDSSFGLEAVTDDLLAPRNLTEDPDQQSEKSNIPSDSRPSKSKEILGQGSKSTKSRKEKFEAAQRRQIAKEKAKPYLGLQKAKPKTGIRKAEQQQSEEISPKPSFPDFNFGALASAVVEMFTSPGLKWRALLAWILMGVGWAAMHECNKAYERSIETVEPTLGSWAVSFVSWFLLGALPFIVGTLWLWLICGFIFRNAASGNRQIDRWSIRGTSELTSTFLVFAFSYLVAGLPVLFVPFLITPFRFFVAPLLLLAAWFNGSPFAIVSVDAFQNFRQESNQWKSFYLFVLTLVLLCLVSSALLSVNVFLLLWITSLAGMAMFVVATIAFAAVTGWHCGSIVKSLQNQNH